jgi:tetratricopeptide (TPR) repeat protein
MKSIYKLSILISISLFTFQSKAQTFDEIYSQGKEKFFSGDFSTGIELLRKAHALDSSNTDGLYLLGYALGYVGNADEGFKYLDRAVSAAPDSIHYRFYRGEIKGYLGDYKGAIEDISHYKDNTTEDPEATYVLLAQNYIDYGDYESAENYLIKAEQEVEALPVTYYYNMARVESKKRQFAKAIQNATKAININPNWALPYFTRAKALFDIGKYQKSIADYDVYIQAMPNDDIAIANRALTKEKSGDLNGALSDYSKAIGLYDKDALTYVNRSTTYQKLKKYDLAIADLNRAESLNQEYYLIYNLRGSLYADKKNYAQAIKDFSKSLALNPKNYSDFISRSMCYLRIDKPDLALADAKKAIALAPNNSDAYLHAGIACFNSNQFNTAIKYYTQGLSKNPEDGRLYYGRSAAYKELGNNGAADKDDAKAKSLLTK